MKKISEGQKQRIGIARAFLKNRKIMILDEATANLDFKNPMEIENEILRRKDITYITVTHHLKKDRYKLFDKIITFCSMYYF